MRTINPGTRPIVAAVVLVALLLLLSLPLSVRAQVLFANGFEGLGIYGIADRALLPGESLSVQAQANPAQQTPMLTFTLPQAPAGASIGAQTGLISWQPTPNQIGTAVFRVRVADQAGNSAETSFDVGVLSENNRPQMGSIPDQVVRLGTSLNLALTATDADPGDSLTYARLAGPLALTVTSGGALSFTPAAADVGHTLVRVGVADGAGASDITEFRLDVQRANQPPQLAPLPDRVVSVAQPLVFTVAATDPDPGDSVSHALELAPTGASIDAGSGEFQYTPDAAQLGRHRVRIAVSDSLGDSASREFDIQVTAAAAPVANGDQYAVTVGETLEVPAPGILGNDTDANQDELTAVLVSGTGSGTLQLQPSGAFTFTPAAATAGEQSKGTATLITVDFESGIPSVIAPGQSTLTSVQGFAGLGAPGNQFGGSFLRGGANVPVTLSLVNLPPHSALDLDFLLAVIDSWDGSGEFPGGDSFEVKLDGVSLFRESFANALGNQIQTYVPPAGVQLARRIDLGFGVGGFHNDSAYDLGADPLFSNIPHTASTATITFTMVVDSDQGINDESWAIDNLRVAIATPPDETTIEAFTYQAADAVSNSAPATVTIAVRPEVFPPRILSQPSLNAGQGLPYRYDIVALSSQAGEALTFAFDQAPAGATISAAGIVEWTPTQAQIGTSRFQVRVTDPRAAAGTQVFVVSVTAAVAVPDVVGQTQAAAGNALAAANLSVGTLTPVASNSIPAGAVVAQTPAAATLVARATAVALDISTGPPPPAPIPVPQVVGRTLADAQERLSAAGFALGATALASDADLPPGTVKLQSPAAASYVPPGSPVALTLVSGAPVRLILAQTRLDAGASLQLAAQAFDEDGSFAQPQPGISYSVTAEPGLSTGAPATISGSTLNSFATTRGRFRVRATRNDTAAFAEAVLSVHAPRPPSAAFAAHERFRTLLAELPVSYRALQLAIQANDTPALAALRSDFGLRADALRADLELLRLAPVTAPEHGFFPSLAALPAAGFPETAADRSWLNTITVANAQIAAATLELADLDVASTVADLAALIALDEQLRLRSVRLAALAPTPFSAVSSNSQTALMLASRMPRLVLAELDSFVRMLEPAPQMRFAASLAGAALAASLRSTLIDDLYGDAYDHVINSGIVLGIANALRLLVGPTEGMDVLTGASLSIHIFREPGSSLDGSFNPIAEMNEVLMIGPDAVAAVRDLLDTLNLEGTDNARELMEKFQGVADAGNAVVAAIEEANSSPDRASTGCLLTDADCVSISWDAGFTSVNEGGNLNLPGPVIILVRDIADGRVHFLVVGFLGQSDPDED